MCIGESRADTLHLMEQTYLREAARDSLSAYDFQVHRNDDAMTWVVLEPARATAGSPRFTICRIHPSVLVMVEDHASARRFCSLPCVEHAVAFAIEMTRRGQCAAKNVHEAPELTQ